MTPQEELAALRRLAELEARNSGTPAGQKPAPTSWAAARNRSEQEPANLYNPTNGQSFLDNALQGTGSGLTSVIRAVGGGRLAAAMGLPATAADAAQSDAPLMATTGGTVGRVVGQAAPAALAIPFTPAALGAAAGPVGQFLGRAAPQVLAGAGTGALMTEGGAGDRLAGGALGGVGGGVGALIPPVARTGFNALRALIEPTTTAGRNRIAGRAVEKFATNPAGVAAATGAPTPTGALLTTAEAAVDPGLMSLQRVIATLDPQAEARIANRLSANNAARTQTLEDLAGYGPAPAGKGGKTAREAAELERRALSDPLYALARAKGFDKSERALHDLPEVFKRFDSRLTGEARTAAQNLGETFMDEGIPSIGQAQLMAQALNDRIAERMGKGLSVEPLQALKREYDKVIEAYSPEMRIGNQVYAATSKPINQMDVAQRLLDTTRSAQRDLTPTGPNGQLGLGERRMLAGKYAQAMNNEEQLVRLAAGKGGATLADVLDPAQLSKVRSVGDELNTLAALAQDRVAAGSQTAKMLAGQNLIKSLAGPLGIPESWLDTTIGNALMKGPNMVYGALGVNNRVNERVADVLLDPLEARAAVAAARLRDNRTPSRTKTQLDRLTARTRPAAIGSAAGAYASEE